MSARPADIAAEALRQWECRSCSGTGRKFGLGAGVECVICHGTGRDPRATEALAALTAVPPVVLAVAAEVEALCQRLEAPAYWLCAGLGGERDDPYKAAAMLRRLSHPATGAEQRRAVISSGMGGHDNYIPDDLPPSPVPIFDISMSDRDRIVALLLDIAEHDWRESILAHTPDTAAIATDMLSADAHRIAALEAEHDRYAADNADLRKQEQVARDLLYAVTDERDRLKIEAEQSDRDYFAVKAERDAAEAERDVLKNCWIEITAKATPYGSGPPDDPDRILTYIIPAGPLHRAAGKLGEQWFGGEQELERLRTALTEIRDYAGDWASGIMRQIARRALLSPPEGTGT